MATFIGTVIIVGLCCLAMSLGSLLSGNALTGGCGGKAPRTPRCKGCPKRREMVGQGRNQEGESGC